MGNWRPPAGTTAAIEALHPEPGCERFTGTVLDDARLLIDIGAEARPRQASFEVRADFFTPGDVLRVMGILLHTGDEIGQYELLVTSAERLHRREHRRVDVELPVSLCALDGGPARSVRGRTCNVSAGGCRVITTEPLAPGIDPLVSLELADGTSIVAGATVLASEHDDSGWTYRLAFTSIDEDDRTHLVDAIAA